jgi:D-alanyl-D-alanine carboxypeptidase (penicillin-binding protein 5/6)
MKIRSFTICLALLVSLGLPLAAPAQQLPVPTVATQPLPVPAAPELAAPSYILMDFNSGAELAGKNPDERREPASLTKMMTEYIVFRELKSGNLKLSDMVTISEKAWRAEGSRTFIEVGKKVPVEVLIKGLIIQSGNDASIALAEHIAGNEETFAQLMNQYAAKLGMTNTQFMNATGLPHPEQLTTARDIAKLAFALIRDFPEYYKWHGEKQFTWNGITQYNRNKLLWRDPTVDGLKTGHTNAAGYCLASSAVRDGMRLVSVVMGSKSEKTRTDETQALLNYGFRFYETHRLYQANTPLANPRIWKGAVQVLPLGLSSDLWVTIPRQQYKNLQASMTVESLIAAPVQAGTTMGSVVVRLGDQVVSEVPLVALSEVEEGGLWRQMIDSILLRFE